MRKPLSLGEETSLTVGEEYRYFPPTRPLWSRGGVLEPTEPATTA